MKTLPAPGRGRLAISASTRWTIAALIVVIALIAAIWPRESADPGTAPAPATTGSAAAFPGEQATVPADELAAARQQAALQPCPAGTAAPGPDSELAGVRVPCLAGGGDVDLGTATAGAMWVINFWAYWCAPCRKELPIFADFERRAGDRVKILTVQGSEGAQNPFLSLNLLIEIGVDLPTVIDPDAAMAAALGVPRVYPSTVLLRADGSVAAVLPQVFTSTDELIQAVDTHLGLTL
ncbi:TlpA disulfide reductase family protein [Williamsia sp. 1135]|jgi:thiol-disulfide isomerase/thioredoxin|uniref:TlpA family protein disulfide reductase n=1 Tax=Williamsia sp. 1135 TaxID=1889262 RepID=UPI000A116FE3|nr:TlpA disulfide reductase family protein [Williamsia sp. 1135]ORM37199.1 alkyl hydroperoxide reductase [Williamsia sp. 1135]